VQQNPSLHQTQNKIKSLIICSVYFIQLAQNLLFTLLTTQNNKPNLKKIKTSTTPNQTKKPSKLLP
jgi:hypothetical protein